MTEMKTPYNFVPLSRFILRPDWAAQVSHDHPFADGVSGELAIELKNHTPLCVGGKQTPATKSAAGKVHFNRTPDENPVIPGSSLKGMLRAVTEIATFSHFRQVEDHRLGVRDMSKADNFYFKNIHADSVRSAWLRFDQGRWLLTPCKFVRLHQQDLISNFRIDETLWTSGRYNSAASRYGLLGGLQQVQFDQEPHKLHHSGVAKNLGQGALEGTLVMTGQPGAHFKQNKSAKKWEFIFYDTDEARVVPANVMADFQFIHSESSEWEYWRKQLADLPSGAPVFYHAGPDGSPRSFGLSMMYRLAYKHSLHDAIGHTQAAHLDEDALDMADLLFGRIDQKGHKSLRGRVGIADAVCQTDEPALTFTESTVLNGPKASFYPAYIRQREKGEYLTLMDTKAELSGWKRYPVKHEAIQYPAGKTAKNPLVQVELETLAKNSTFKSKVRFHNLRPAELGALLWAIDFGDNDELRHGLGMGKPYGLGQVSLKTDSGACRIRPNDPQQEVADKALFLSACRHVFDQFMQDAWSQATGGTDIRWNESEPLRQLCAMAKPENSEGRTDLEYWTDPKEFQNAKTQQFKLEPYDDSEKYSPEPPPSYQPVASAADCDLSKGMTLAEKDRQESQLRAQQEKEKWERIRAKDSMTEEDRLLAEVGDWQNKHSTGGLSKTDAKKFEKAFKDAEVKLADNPEYKEPMLKLANQLYACGIKLVEKIAKRIIKNLG